VVGLGTRSRWLAGVPLKDQETMPRRVLITGSSTLLASHLAALRLASSEDALLLLLQRPDGVFWAEEEALALVRHAVVRGMPAPEAEARWESLRARVHALRGEVLREDLGLSEALPDSPLIDEAWYLSGGYRPGAGAWAGDGGVLRRLLPMLSRLGVQEFNHVGPALAGEAATGAGPRVEDGFEAFHRGAEHDVEAACEAAGVGHRLFRTSLLIGESPPLRGPDREGFLQMIEALHDLKAELEERLPGFLGSRPLRCQAPVGASLGLVRVEQAAERLLRVAHSPGTLSGRFNITAPERSSFAQLCERAGAALGLHLVTTEDPRTLNAVDQALHARLGGFQAWLTAPGGPNPEAAWGSPGPSPEQLRLEPEAQVALFQAIRESLDAARAERRARAAALFSSLGARTVERGGSTLTYFAAGSRGTPVVLLNALGQGLFYWSRLVDCLMQNHRVFIWEPRGLESGPQPFLIRDQVEDLEAVLRQEGIDACHLVGWCTAPKVAVEFYRRRPDAVTSMVFLNGSLRWSGSSKEFETAYERNFEPLCSMLVRRPAMAATMLKSIRLSTAREDGDLSGLNESELATRVLSLMNRDLKPHTLGPFRSESVFVNYAHQVMDFWSHDVRASLGQVQVPVLLMSAEHDAVASPDTSRQMARLIPNARHVHVQGATHYCLYDRPEFVAEQLEAFFQSVGLPREPLRLVAAGLPPDLAGGEGARPAQEDCPPPAAVERLLGSRRR
jgi:pimeloyl-ACP methyl ester carboxylesterase